MPLPETIGMIAQGAQIAGQAGQALGIGQAKQDRRQLKQQGKLTAQQVEAQKQLAEHQAQMQLDMWNNTNYKAQVDHLKQAGLNPALLYGKGGGGGATTGSPMATGVSGGQASNAAATQQANQMGMMNMAQMKLMEAQARNLDADTANKGGVQKENIAADTALKNTQIDSLTQGIQNQRAVEELTKVETDLKNITKQIEGDEWTIHNRMEIIAQEANIAEGRASSILAQANVDEQTIREKINIIKQTAINTGIEAAMMKSNIAVNQEKINEITNGIMQRWKDIEIKGIGTRYEHEDRILAIKEYTANALKVAGIIAAGNIAGDLVQIATRRVPTGKVSRTTKDGDDTYKHETNTYE